MSMKQRIGIISLLGLLSVGALFLLTIQGGQEPTQASAKAKETAALDTSLDTGAILAPRTMGDPDAPVKIEEFASLSCSHCAHFYEDTFPLLKTQYIDTGKVYFVYSDFPLNGSALDAAVIARCLPESAYFKFIKFLFETQDDWAYEQNYRQILMQNAKLLGGKTDRLESCLNSNELKLGLAEIQQEASKKYSIRSTPSFVINDEQVMSGAKPLSAFKEAIDPLLKESTATE